MMRFEFRGHRKALKAESAEAQKLFVMLKLLPPEEVSHPRPPLAFILVINTERSKSDDLLNGVLDACHSFVDDRRLQADDFLSVISCRGGAACLLPTEQIGDRQRAHSALDSARLSSGGNCMARGLELAITEVRELPENTARRIVLFTDGGTDDQEHCRALASRLSEMNVPVVAVGIGDEYDLELLRDIASRSLGRPYHLRVPSESQGLLDEELASSLREVVTDVRMSLSLAEGAAIDSVIRVYPSLSGVSLDHQPFRLGNVAAGRQTTFILEVTVSGFNRSIDRARLLQIQLTAEVPGMNRREESPVQDLFIDFTTDPAAITAIDAEVMDNVKQANVDALVQRAATNVLARESSPFCPDCGSAVEPGAMGCDICGWRLLESVAAQETGQGTPKARTVASRTVVLCAACNGCNSAGATICKYCGNSLGEEIDDTLHQDRRKHDDPA
jgi:Ca-activated chloride channel family protein